MGKGGKGGSAAEQEAAKKRRKACGLAAALAIAILILLAALYLAVFRPKDPKIQLPMLQLLSLEQRRSGAAAGLGFAAASPPISSANLTLLLHIWLYNPNKATFFVENGGMACLFYYGSQIGFSPLPSPAQIAPESSSTISLPLSVHGFHGSSPLQGPNLVADSAAGILQLSLSVTVVGHVTALSLFTHHSDVVSKCRVNVSFVPPGIMSYICHKSYSLDL